MRSNERAATHTEQSRRAQLVTAAIEVIAARGYAKASLADVAGHAGTGKGVLLYHFAGKDDLISAVVAEILEVARAEVAPKVAAAEGARARLATYIVERIRFLVPYRTHMQALLSIALNHQDASGDLVFGDMAEPAVDAIAALLRAGQDEGAFRDFAVRPMAVAVSQAIDGMLFQLLLHPDIDLELYARELTTTFDLATRRTP